MRTIIIGILQFVATTVFAQNFTIKGTVIGEDSIPVISANIVLQNTNSKIVTGIETNVKGEFILQNLIAGENYKLSISFVGYETHEFDFEKPTKDIDLGNIVLFKTSVELQGAEVKARITKMLADRRIIYPTQQQLAITADGVTLLNAMKLPNLSAIPGSTEIKYWGQGDLKFYINDNEATATQIRNLSPKDIVRIEYIDRPGVEYNSTGKGLVLRYITKQFERGATNSISVDKVLNRNSGSADVESRINYKNSEFAVNYNVNYEKSKHFNLTKTDETFNLDNGVFHRNETTTEHNGSSVNNDIALAYIYSRPKKERFYIKAEYSTENTPSDNTTSILYNSGIRNDTTNKYNLSSQKDKTYKSAVYYRKHFGEKQFLTLYSTYYSTRLNSLNNYKELNNTSTIINDITSNVDAKSQGLFAQALYSIVFSDNITFTTALLHQYTNSKNTYTDNNSSFSNVNRNITTSYNQLSSSFGKFYLDFYLQLQRNHTNISNEYKYTRFELNPSISGRYVFNDRNYIGFDSYFSPNRPNIADLSEATRIIDEIQVRRGNPNLKSGYTLGQGLDGNIGFGKFDVSWYASYEYLYNEVQEKTLRDNNIIVRSADNIQHSHWFKSGVDISPDLFDWLNISLSFGYNRFGNNSDNYKTKYGKLWMRTDVALIWERWMLSYILWTHNNEFSGEHLWTSGRFMYFTLLRTWFDGKLSTTLELQNPFSKKYSKQGTINYSKIAPYESWIYYDYAFRMLTFRISYKFNIWRKSSNENISTGVRRETGTVSGNKSAEKK
ncbi:MAG: TonB-dependent receptor family protein [Prevotellaceae bacterium]|nr:TonB-dependent receptor family protein [Prevotellaceae bacterium]